MLFCPPSRIYVIGELLTGVWPLQPQTFKCFFLTCPRVKYQPPKVKEKQHQLAQLSVLEKEDFFARSRGAELFWEEKGRCRGRACKKQMHAVGVCVREVQPAALFFASNVSSEWFIATWKCMLWVKRITNYDEIIQPLQILAEELHWFGFLWKCNRSWCHLWAELS